MKKFLQLLAVFAVILVLGTLILNLGCRQILEKSDSELQELMEGTGCPPTESACKGNVLMLCNANHVWETNVDCSDFNAPKQCCVVAEVTSCYDAEECNHDSQ